MKVKYRYRWGSSTCGSKKYKHKRKRNKVCYAPWHDRRDDCVTYWQRGFSKLCSYKYKCTVKRRTGSHIYDCHVEDWDDNCVVIRCRGERIVVCFDDICSLELDCANCHDWDWDDIYRLFD